MCNVYYSKRFNFYVLYLHSATVTVVCLLDSLSTIKSRNKNLLSLPRCVHSAEFNEYRALAVHVVIKSRISENGNTCEC